MVSSQSIGAALRTRFAYLPLWLFIVAIALLWRPLTPIDETRVVTVAWEMWQRHDFLVPYVNGEPYSHKPPLLQWGIQLSWLLFGVNDWTPRLIAPLYSLGNLILTAVLARRLWPHLPEAARLAPLFLIGTFAWAFFSTLTLYDMLMGFFTLLALHGVLDAAAGKYTRSLAVLGIAVGGAVLAKGPVVLVFLLPVALSWPWWQSATPTQTRAKSPYYFSLLGGILIGAALALSWALPAARAGGEEYGQAILWGQFAGRVTHSFAHNRPWWWYLPLLPVLLLPWSLWPSLWRNLFKLRLDSGVRFCLIQALPALLIFCLISGKQAHYLLPIFPALALLAARALSDPRAEGQSKLLWGLALLPLLPMAVYRLLQLVQAVLGVPAPGNVVMTTLSQLSWEWNFTAVALTVLLLVNALAYAAEKPASSVPAIAVATAGLFALIHGAYYQTQYAQWDVAAFARRVAELQNSGARIAHNGDYHGDFQFLGRLQQPLEIAQGPLAVKQWSQAHPDGYVIGRFEVGRASFPPADRAELSQNYRGRKLALWKASAIADAPGPNLPSAEPTPPPATPALEAAPENAPSNLPAVAPVIPVVAAPVVPKVAASAPPLKPAHKPKPLAKTVERKITSPRPNRTPHKPNPRAVRSTSSASTR